MRPLKRIIGLVLLSAFCHSVSVADRDDDLAGGQINEYGKYIPLDADGRSNYVPPDPATWLENAKELIEDLGEGQYRIGKVLIHASTSSVTIPARVNALSGPMEYALVTQTGKVHEALLTTDASPFHVHLAALLTGLAEPMPNGVPRPIEVWVEWKGNGPLRVQRLEEWIGLAEESISGPIGGTLEVGTWNYGGSILEVEGFAASREGSLITLIGDQAALVLNPRPGHRNDDLHVPHAKVMPPKGFPLSVVLRPARSASSPDTLTLESGSARNR